MRLVAHFVVLLLALSVLFDLMGQISVDFLELEGPFESDKQASFSAVYLGMLNEDWGKGSLAGLLWHYMPAIVLSLSISIAWALIDIAWAPKESQNGRCPSPPVEHLSSVLYVLHLLEQDIGDFQTIAIGHPCQRGTDSPVRISVAPRALRRALP